MFLTDAKPNSYAVTKGGLFAICNNSAEKERIYTSFLGVGIDFGVQLIDHIAKIKAANYFTVLSPKEFKKLMDDAMRAYYDALKLEKNSKVAPPPPPPPPGPKKQNVLDPPLPSASAVPKQRATLSAQLSAASLRPVLAQDREVVPAALLELVAGAVHQRADAVQGKFFAMRVAKVRNTTQELNDNENDLLQCIRKTLPKLPEHELIKRAKLSERAWDEAVQQNAWLEALSNYQDLRTVVSFELMKFIASAAGTKGTDSW